MDFRVELGDIFAHAVDVVNCMRRMIRWCSPMNQASTQGNQN